MGFFFDSASITRDDVVATNEAKWSKIFPLGVTKFRSDFPDGKIEFDAELLGEMVANWKAEGSPERAVNYFHRGSSDGGATPIDEKVAAGWIQNLELRADGLYAQIRWTDRAREFIQKDELRYLSPEFLTDSTDANTGEARGAKLLGAALLNDPFLVELPKVAASERAHVEEELKEMKVQLSETTVQLSAAKAEVAKLVEVEKLAAEKISLAETRAVSAEKERDELKAEKRTREVNDFCAALIVSGKITPAMRPGVEKLALAHGVDAVKFFDETPAVVDVSGKATGVSAAPADDKASAKSRWEAKVQSLLSGGMKFPVAVNEARRAMPTEYNLIFGGK